MGNIGQLIKTITSARRFKFLALIFFITGCSESKRYPEPTDIIFPAKYHTQEILKNRSLRDLDQDGILDQNDEDIDNDGISNYLDEYPFDRQRQGTDFDQDGIPDFLDFEVQGALKEGMSLAAARLQTEIFLNRRLLVFNGDISFSLTELKSMWELWLASEWQKLPALERLKVVFAQPSFGGQAKAQYSKVQRAITFFIDANSRPSRLQFLFSLMHEFAHSLRYQHPALFKRISTLAGWREASGVYYYQALHQRGEVELPVGQMDFGPEQIDKLIQGEQFPSVYSKFGPEEMLAECLSVSFFAESDFYQAQALDWKARYIYLDTYLLSSMHEQMKLELNKFFNRP